MTYERAVAIEMQVWVLHPGETKCTPDERYNGYTQIINDLVKDGETVLAREIAEVSTAEAYMILINAVDKVFDSGNSVKKNDKFKYVKETR